MDWRVDWREVILDEDDEVINQVNEGVFYKEEGGIYEFRIGRIL